MPYTIQLLCQFVHVSRAAYYKWLNRQPTRLDVENAEISKYMLEKERKNNFTIGVKLMATYIDQDTSYKPCISRVRRLRDANGIVTSIRKAKHDRQAEHKEVIKGNLLLNQDYTHNFKANHVNQVWVTDCTELIYGNTKQKLRLSAIKDLYDHRIVAWAVAPSETAQLVTDTIAQAIEQTQAKPKILHSDQGSSYTSSSYNKKLDGHGIKHSMSRPGHPGDNAPMESFWSHIKDEYFDFTNPTNKSDMITKVESAMYWYNYERRQLTLNGMTPMCYRDHAVA